MHKRLGKLAFVVPVIMLLASWIGYFAYEYLFSGTPARPAPLAIDSKLLNLGEIWSNDRHQVSLPLTNEGELPVTVTSWQTSCTCATVQPSAFTLGPEETIRLSLVLDLTKASQPNVAGTTSDIDVWFSAETSGSAPKQRAWRLIGKAKDPIVGTPRVIDFGDDLILGKSQRVASVEVKLAKGVSDVILNAQSDLFTCSLSRKPNVADTRTLDVTSSAAAPVGPISGYISITPIAGDGKSELPVQRIAVIGVVTQGVIVIPSAVMLGPMTLGDRHKGSIQLMSRSKERFRVLETLSDSADIGVSGMEPTALFEQTEVFFVFEANTAGAQRSNIRIRVQMEGESEESQLVVPVVSHGLAVK